MKNELSIHKQQAGTLKLTESHFSVIKNTLVNELAQNDVISNERKMALLSENWKGLLDASRINEIGWQTSKVPDAEKELD